jgi:hypothetical protein
MTKAILIPALLLLSGCMTLTATSQDCMKRSKFSGVMQCIDQSVAANRALRGDPLVQEYVLTGRSLEKQVAAGTLGENDARLKLIKKLNEVRERDIAEQAAIAQTFSGNRSPRTPGFTDCGRTPGVPSCLTY